jgi:phosphate transport system substrate-binding protein
MPQYKKYLLFFFSCLLFAGCNKKDKEGTNTETILKGSTTIYVDETVVPIVEDEIMVFESKYDAKIKLVSKSEAEVLNSLFNKKVGIAVLSRNLTEKELNVFEQRKIFPKITKFATDAIAFVSNKSSKDTLIALNDVVGFMKGVRNSSIKGLVFDNPNSSTVNYMITLAGINSLPEKDVFSFKTNNEVLKFVSENDGMIGIVGVNWLSQPDPSMIEIIENTNVLSIKEINGKGFYGPTQNNLAEETYPLARDLYIVNCQGYDGLGMGFASFVAGDIGQRIVLKSGLLPVKIPTRNLNIVKGQKNKK